MRTAARWSLAVALAASASFPAAALAAGDGTRSAPTSGRIADAAVAAVRDHAAAAAVGAHQRFDVTDVLIDRDGTSHVRMARTYRGLPVRGGDLVAHRSAAGRWLGASLTLAKAPSLSVQPSVSRAAAERAAAAGSENRGVDGLEVASSHLVVDALDRVPTLAWEVTTVGTRADQTPSRLVSHVSAASGRVLDAAEQIQTSDVGGTGNSLYSGTVPLRLNSAGSVYELRDTTRGGSFTTDLKNKTDSGQCQYFGTGCATGTLFTSADTVFGTGSTASRESAAVDAQYGANMTWDYYRDTHGRNGIANDGKGYPNRTHYGRGYVNAFWNGSSMTYGDGDGRSYGPLTSLDVAGHEMSHGVTEKSANLTYSGESGGLNESTSDIFGTLVEFYANNAKDPGDYLIGEQFDLAKHLGFRRMDNPASDGSSANCWSASVGSLDVHYSSGVGNHFFYLLAEGSGSKVIGGVTHSSPTCNGSSVTGIGRDAAGRIWYRALTVYMTSSTDYHGARTASLRAAADLFGGTSTQYDAVNAAWAAVNVS